MLTDTCFYCEGRGTLKSAETICYEIFRDLERECGSPEEGGRVHILVNPEIEKALKEEEQKSIIDLERRIGKRIVIIGKENFHMEQYEINF